MYVNALIAAQLRTVKNLANEVVLNMDTTGL
jgi:hypothetical protein